MDNKAMNKLSYGLFVVTVRDGMKQNGCITNTAAQVTTDPNRISLTVNKANLTHDMIDKSGAFNVSILSEKASFDTFKHFGFQTGKEVDRGSLPAAPKTGDPMIVLAVFAAASAAGAAALGIKRKK